MSFLNHFHDRRSQQTTNPVSWILLTRPSHATRSSPKHSGCPGDRCYIRFRKTNKQSYHNYQSTQTKISSENKQTAWSQALLHLIGWSNGGQFSRPITDRSKATQCNPGLLPKHNWKLPYTRETGYLDSKENSLIFLRDSPWSEPSMGGKGEGGGSVSG